MSLGLCLGKYPATLNTEMQFRGYVMEGFALVW